jgi:hypothetical protein
MAGGNMSRSHHRPVDRDAVEAYLTGPAARRLLATRATLT